MGSTWKPHAVHMQTMLCQHKNNMVSTWYLDTMWFLYTRGHNVVTTLTPHGFSVDTTWFPCGYHVVSMCTTCGFQVDNTWIQMWTLHDFRVKTTLFPCRHYMVSVWTPRSFYGHHMLPHGHNMVAMWILCGFHVHTMWFQGGHHLVSRLTQCGFQVDNTVSKVDTMWFLQDTTGFPHGCHVVYIWTPCVVEVTTWKPAPKTALHEANWLPYC